MKRMPFTLSKLPITQGFPYDTEPLIDHELFATLELILFYPNLFHSAWLCTTKTRSNLLSSIKFNSM